MRHAIFLSAVLVSSSCAAQTYDYFDRNGNYAGQMRDTYNGHEVFDRGGNSVGSFREQPRGVRGVDPICGVSQGERC